MIRLALRLSLGGGRESLLRLVAIASGVMIGVALLAFLLSGLRVLAGSINRPCWQCTSDYLQTQTPNDKKDHLLWRAKEEIYRGKRIQRYDIAATGPQSPTIPGIPAMPKTGEYYVSPALAELLAATPDNQLDDRFPGKIAGEIGKPGLDSPDTLIAVVGHSPTELAGRQGVMKIWTIEDSSKGRVYGPFVIGMFAAGVGGLLFSVIMLITTATRLSAARREEKFAALRLLGATPRQVTLFGAIDAALGAGIGAVLGMGLFYILRPFLTTAISGIVSFFPEDLTPGMAGVAAILLCTPLIAALTAIFSLRRVRISPLGVSRKATPKPPRPWRILPLLAGFVVVTIVWLINRDITDTVEKAELLPHFLAGFALVLVGLISAGSWLTMVATRFLSRTARTAPSLLAMRRLADNPKQAFRTAAVLTIAAFLCSMIAVIAPLFTNIAEPSKDSLHYKPVLTYSFTQQRGMETNRAQRLLADLQKIPGVNTVTGYDVDHTPKESFESMLIPCRDLTKLGAATISCPAGATAMKVSIGYGEVLGYAVGEEKTKPVTTPLSSILKRKALKLIVHTDGGTASAERVRTVMSHYSEAVSWGFMTGPELRLEERQVSRDIQTIINGAFLVVLFVAGCSLAVAVGGSLVERKRPFGLLRVAGASFAQLSKVILIESVVPLATAILGASAIGFAMAALMIQSFASPATIQMPSASYYIVMGLGILTALLAISAVFPLLAAITKPENARFE